MKNKLCASLVGLALAATPLVPTVGAAASTTGFVRGVYGRDSSATGTSTLRATGFNAVTVQPWRDHLDALAAQGMGGVVWLFGYNNDTCSFDRDDAWVRQTVGAIAGHPAITAYNVADEPNFRQCPDSPQEIAARARLVKSLDPANPTYVVVAAWDGREGFPYQHFAGTTDIMGLDVYPCSHSMTSCKYADIDSAVEEAVKDGVTRYWAILQDFSDAWYRQPTAAELERQFDHWARSGMEGYFLYHWNEGSVESRPDHLSVLRQQNSRTFGSGSTPTPTPTPTPSPSPSPSPSASPTPSASPSPSPSPSASPSPTPSASPSPGSTPTPSPSATPGTPSPEPSPSATPVATEVPDASPILRPTEPLWPAAGGRGGRADRKPPSRPKDLLSAALETGSYLWWDSASDDRGVVGYAIWRDGRRIGRTRSTSFEDLKGRGSRHVYAVRAFDAAGNRSKAAVLRVRTVRNASTLARPCLVPPRVYRTC